MVQSASNLKVGRGEFGYRFLSSYSKILDGKHDQFLVEMSVVV